VLLLSAVTGQGLQTLVGRVTQMLAEIKRAEAEEAAKKPPIEFASGPAIRTGDFQTTAVPNITPPNEGESP
jgi:hypothetical protein